eukprot:gnl/TRDRNA2_/TRDRNA2_180534_c0_seq1.p1 gnl/TRDRNA2_/TRDRNA2_180534_c0~~gnl/TRDRNA2_/TRDRNA2_180534_c0_seq1.p1  ORF type:complete len:333 (+),score=50.48 gnl/TRDRNA2_/TRDRNA2_180534_c0_seq1:64-1062(+)
MHVARGWKLVMGGQFRSAVPACLMAACLLAWLGHMCTDALRIAGPFQAVFEPIVFADPAKVQFEEQFADEVLLSTGKKEMLPGRSWKQVLVGAGRVPHLRELLEIRLVKGGKEWGQVHKNLTTVYFGIQGECTVWQENSTLVSHPEFTHSGLTHEVRSVKRGAAAVVFPGVPHSLVHPGTGAPPCRVLAVKTNSGPAGTAAYVRTGEGAFVAAGYDQDLPPVKTAHESALLSKKVYLAHGRVPGLFQVSLSSFSPLAECEEHQHATAAEIYVNFDGVGCHVKAKNANGSESVFDLTGGKVAILNPRTVHSAWNSDKDGACQNFNMMIGPTNE